MIRLSAVLVCLLVAQGVFAAEKPAALTPKEIAEGWILLFDGETTFGLMTEGDVAIESGALLIRADKLAGFLSTSHFPAFECKFEKSKDGKEWTSEVVHYDGKSGPKRFGFLGAVTAYDRHFRSIKLRAAGAQTLFNAKDLTGWKVFDDPKRNASKWSVTKEGWLNVKNGPGDLQTEKKFDDFILQFDCISNGKALNSGIFFRCIANEYQNGYEAQVQNGFKDNDRTKPADFGTGAIYRRIAARKVIPNDNEWFTMTVLAHGEHIATWVNGYQTVDWTDNRPADDNPRKGYRAAAGHISIQGHDPTTDLSFRNVRIVELKSDKSK